jgi:hypothetical protein
MGEGVDKILGRVRITWAFRIKEQIITKSKWQNIFMHVCWEKSNKLVSRAKPRIKNYSNKTSTKGYDPLMPSGTNTYEIFYTQTFIKREQENKVQIKHHPLIPIYRE